MSGTSLVKNKSYEFVPGIPGTSDIPGVDVAQGTPEHYSTKLVTITNCYPTICSTTTPVVDGSGIGSSIGDSGYNAPAPCSKVMVCSSEIVRESVYHPLTSGAPGETGIPGVSATLGEIIEHLNEGWNSHSRSVDKLELGNYISYRVNEGVKGVLVSIGVNGKSAHKINTFAQSILVENSGILVFEDGVKVKTIKNSYNKDSEIRLYRQPDNSIACAVTTGEETIVYVFDNLTHGSSLIPIYVYAHLYIADDSVEDASLKTGQIHFGKA